MTTAIAIGPTATPRFRFAGIFPAAEAFSVCGAAEKLPSPATDEEWKSVAWALRKFVLEGQLSLSPPGDRVWVNGRWNNHDWQWEWADGRPTFEFPWAPGEPSDVRRQSEQPWLAVDVNGQAMDLGSDDVAGVLCSPTAPPDAQDLSYCCMEGGCGDCLRMMVGEGPCGDSAAHCRACSTSASWCTVPGAFTSDATFSVLAADGHGVPTDRGGGAVPSGFPHSLEVAVPRQLLAGGMVLLLSFVVVMAPRIGLYACWAASGREATDNTWRQLETSAEDDFGIVGIAEPLLVSL